jgi:hypothetical protein
MTKDSHLVLSQARTMYDLSVVPATTNRTTADIIHWFCTSAPRAFLDTRLDLWKLIDYVASVMFKDKDKLSLDIDTIDFSALGVARTKFASNMEVSHITAYNNPRE